MDRRKFIKKTCKCALVSAVPIAVINLTSCSDYGDPSEEEILQDINDSTNDGSLKLDLTSETLSPLQTNGVSIVTKGNFIDSNGLLLLRVSDIKISAFSRRCTHSGSSVNSFANGISVCSSHGSEFDTSGKVVNGPASTPLKEYQTSLEESILTIFPS